MGLRRHRHDRGQRWRRRARWRRIRRPQRPRQSGTVSIHLAAGRADYRSDRPAGPGAGVFPNNTLKTQLSTYIANYVSRSAAYAPLAEYGISNTTVATAVQAFGRAPGAVNDTDIQAPLAARISDGTLPAADARTVYIFFYPQATAITKGSGKSCQDFAGYHGWTKVGGADAPYCVIPQCSSATLPGTLAALTIATSHEISEAVTDPVGLSLFDMNDPIPVVRAVLRQRGRRYVRVAQRLRSHRAGRGHQRPRLVERRHAQQEEPLPARTRWRPSFFAIPVMPERRALQIGSALRQTELVTLTGTTPRSVEVNLISDGASGVMITAEAEEVPIGTTTVPNPAKVLTFTWQEAPPRPRHRDLWHHAAPATTGQRRARLGLYDLPGLRHDQCLGHRETQTMWAGRVNIR